MGRTNDSIAAAREQDRLLAVAPITASASGATTTSDRTGDAVAARILVVDDTPANLLAMTAFLKPLGVEVVEARSGTEALGHVADGAFAVVLLDVQMPGMDGFEVAARMRQMEHGRELPILFLTAIHRDEAFVRRGYAVGAADYVTKPFDIDVLRARVKAFVDLFRQREDLRRRHVAVRTRERDEAQRRLVAFEKIASAAIEADDLPAFFDELLKVFVEAADAADSATILIRDGDELREVAATGRPAAATAAVRVKAATGATSSSSTPGMPAVRAPLSVPVGEGFAGAIAASGRSATIGFGALARLTDAEQARERATRAMFGVPLVVDHGVAGVATISSRRADEFTDAEKVLFSAMAERVAWAVSKRHSRERLYSLLVTAPAMIAVFRGPNLVCEFANEAFRAWFEGSAVVGEQARCLFDSDAAVSGIEGVLRTGETLSIAELSLLRRDPSGPGSESHVEFLVQPLRGPAGEVEAAFAFIADVTQRVRARRALEAAQHDREELLRREQQARLEAELASRAKDEFLATVSHELRTPLNAVLGWTIIAKENAGKELLAQALTVIERNARAQARIIEDVLDISRVVRGKLRLDLIEVDAAVPLIAASQAVRPAADAKGVALEVEAGDAGFILADADRVQQIVWNLLSNAVKFTPAGGKVVLRVARDAERLAIEVADTGEGIGDDFLPHVFDAFRQADGTTTRRHGGIGLGLAIVKHLVHAHGGTISAHSAGLGQGATFRVELPVRVARAAASVPPGDAATGAGAGAFGTPRLTGVKVLVVDDEEDARSLLHTALAARGAAVVVASDADGALELMKTFLPDVLVSDIGMPLVDGYAFMRRVRRLPADCGGRTRAIALTAFAREEDAQRAFAAGFHRHISKPVDPAQLVSVIANLAGLALDGGDEDGDALAGGVEGPVS